MNMSLDDVSAYLKVQHRRRGISIPVSSWSIPADEQHRRERELSAKRRGRAKPMGTIPQPVDNGDNVDIEPANTSNRSTESLAEFEDATAMMEDPFRWKKIILQVCHKHGVTVLEIMAHRRSRKIVNARQEAMWRLKTETTLSYPEIGRRMGGFDHSTVISSLRVFDKRNALQMSKN